MRYLLGTASVHTTAAACDYLAGRAGADDEVLVVTVDEPALAARDAGDAANVARTRLVEPAVEVRERSGDPAAELRALAAEAGVDELLVGPRRGDPSAAAGGDPALGSTARALAADPPVPVVVLPPGAGPG